jgi:hypothetical protein
MPEISPPIVLDKEDVTTMRLFCPSLSLCQFEFFLD